MVELEGMAPEDGEVHVSVGLSTCASWDASAGQIHIPCLDLGDCFWLNLGVQATPSVTLSIGDFGLTWCRDPEATFQTGPNLLNVPCLDLGTLMTYWFAMALRNPETLSFDRVDFGMN